MKIGIDCNSLTRNLTGVGTYLLDTLVYLDKHAPNDTFYLYINDDEKCTIPSSEKFIIRKKKSSPVKWYMMILPSQIKKDCLDLFWEPMNRLPIVSSDLKLVTTVHDMASYLYPQYCSWQTALMERLFLKNTLLKSNSIVAISEATQCDISNNFGISKESINVIYNGDSPYKGNREYLEEYKQKVFMKYNITSKYFLCLGSINPRKNLEVVLKAFFEYRKNGGKNCLVIAGKKIAKENRIQKLIEYSEYKNYIFLTGYVSEEEKEYLYKYSECLLFPSRYEGFGFPIIEAMSLGVLVITSNNSSMPEVGGQGALYLNNIDDPSELCGLMHKVDSMSNDEKTKRISMGYENVKRFSRENATDKLISIFHSTI